MNADVHIADFAPCHYAAMQLREEDARDLAGIGLEYLLDGWQGGRTVFKGGKPAFIYGYKANYGTLALWAVSSPLAASLPLFITRLARGGIRGAFQAGAHRIEAYCHVGNIRSLAWLTRSLKFRVEGLMKRSGPNRQDRFLLALTDTDYKEDRLWAV